MACACSVNEPRCPQQPKQLHGILMNKPTSNLPKRHCMIVFAAYPLSETRVQREAEVLLSAGYNVDVICLRLPGEPARDVYKGVRIFRLNNFLYPRLAKRGGLAGKFLSYLFFFISAGIQVTKLHLGTAYHTIQVHNLPDFLVFSTLIPKIMGAPIILDLHDLMPEFFAGRFGQTGNLAAWLIRRQEKWACRYADHVITVSEHWRQALITRGVTPEKCSVVMNVADDRVFKRDNGKPSVRPEPGTFQLVYHGAMPARYGLDLAVQAVEQLREDIPGIHLRLIGCGEHLPYLTRLVNELGLAQHISFEGLHLAEELPDIILSCDLGIVPYRNDIFTDGLLPTKLMEYTALGLPAVAARTTAISTYFKDTSVTFFEPGNVEDLARVILQLYRHPDALAQLALRSVVFNQQYNWGKTGSAYVELINDLGKKRKLSR